MSDEINEPVEETEESAEQEQPDEYGRPVEDANHLERLLGATSKSGTGADDDEPAPEEVDVESEATEEDSPRSEPEDAGLEAVLERARAIGLEDRDLEGLDPAAADRVVAIAERQMAREFAKSRKGESDEQQPETQESSDPLADLRAAWKEIEENADDYDPAVVKLLQAQQAAIERQANTVMSFEQQQQQHQMQQLVNDFNQSCDSLSGFDHVLGKGEPNEQQWAARREIADEVERMAAGYTQQGKAAPSMEQLVKRAAFGLYGEKVKTNAVRQKVSQRQTQVSSRPSDREGSAPMDREERALATIREKLTDMNYFGD